MFVHAAKYKKLRKPTQLGIVLTTIIGAVLVAALIYGFRNQPAHQPIHVAAVRMPTSTHTISTNYGLPIRLQIPKMHVDSHVLYMGLTKAGNMSVPTNVIDTGWYKYSTLPGNTGTAVIAGHLDGIGGVPGVFSNLNKLVPGDIVTVTENNGLTVSFIVRHTQSYYQNEQPTEVFNSTSGAHLNLITCTGAWDSTEHRFAKRLVVFADKAS